MTIRRHLLGAAVVMLTVAADITVRLTSAPGTVTPESLELNEFGEGRLDLAKSTHTTAFDPFTMPIRDFPRDLLFYVRASQW